MGEQGKILSISSDILTSTWYACNRYKTHDFLPKFSELISANLGFKDCTNRHLQDIKHRSHKPRQHEWACFNVILTLALVYLPCQYSITDFKSWESCGWYVTNLYEFLRFVQQASTSNHHVRLKSVEAGITGPCKGLARLFNAKQKAELQFKSAENNWPTPPEDTDICKAHGQPDWRQQDRPLD